MLTRRSSDLLCQHKGGTLGHKGLYQVNKKNTAPIPKLQMVPMLKLILEMDMS